MHSAGVTTLYLTKKELYVWHATGWSRRSTDVCLLEFRLARSSSAGKSGCGQAMYILGKGRPVTQKQKDRA